MGDDSTWEDFRQFKRFVRARLFECFNDFKLRHSEYRKKTHGYSIKSLEHNLREDYFRFENDLSIAVNLFKKAVMRYQEAAPAQKLHFQQKLEKAERKLSEIQHHFISLKMRLSENN
ncbi:MAG: hypothetical protein BWZ03_00463 [bacterium ADurb.BinA186]|nr:MAG: hypothetical protein BWZ03_00463 [bacterium ADurb.BinA186]